MRDLETLEFSMCTMATLHCFSSSLTSQKIHWFNHNLPFHLVLHHFLASEYSHGRQHDHAWQGLGMAIVMVTWTCSARLCTSCKNPNASGLKASNAVPDNLRESLLLRSKGMVHKWNHYVPWDWATLALLGLKMMPYTLTWRYMNKLKLLHDSSLYLLLLFLRCKMLTAERKTISTSSNAHVRVHISLTSDKKLHIFYLVYIIIYILQLSLLT